MKIFIFLLFLFPSVLIAQSETNMSLYYENNAFNLDAYHIQKIDSLKQFITTVDSVTIKIHGFANAYGTDKYNLQLSQNRAAQVASLLKRYNILEIEGYGELESISSKSRRVDILITSYIFPKKDTISMDELVSNSKQINDLSDLEVGDKIVLDGILFLGGTDTILDESTIALQELYTYLKTYKKTHIHLIGHICCHGNIPSDQDGFNIITKTYTLSNDRAKAIYNYLIDKGISKDRLTFEGKAYLEPLGKGSKYDRRVEVEIIE